MRGFRLIFVVVVCLVIGFAAGWQLKPRDLPPASLAQSQPVASVVRSPTENQTSQPIEAALKTPSPAPAAETFRSGNPSLSERLGMLRWMKKNGAYFSVQLFDADHKISPQMALFYGLTPRETEQLEQASQQAEQRLEELHRQHAQLDPTSNSEKLTVTIPPFPDEGGKVYNDLFGAFSSVLGKERYAVFNDISGDQLENAFENFGTARTRYDVSIQTGTDGKQVYNVGRSYVFDAVDYKPGLGGSSSGTTSASSYSTFQDQTGITKNFPLLKTFALPLLSPQKSK